VWALLLALTGTYAQLVDYVIFADWIFRPSGRHGVRVPQQSPARSETGGTFRAPGYPLVPALFVLAAIAVVSSVLLSAPARSLIGMGLLATGVPAYLYWTRRSKGGA
jgi:APA family basic amino acid/polyamine antiporter